MYYWKSLYIYRYLYHLPFNFIYIYIERERESEREREGEREFSNHSKKCHIDWMKKKNVDINDMNRNVKKKKKM